MIFFMIITESRYYSDIVWRVQFTAEYIPENIRKLRSCY